MRFRHKDVISIFFGDFLSKIIFYFFRFLLILCMGKNIKKMVYLLRGTPWCFFFFSVVMNLELMEVFLYPFFYQLMLNPLISLLSTIMRVFLRSVKMTFILNAMDTILQIQYESPFGYCKWSRGTTHGCFLFSGYIYILFCSSVQRIFYIQWFYEDKFISLLIFLDSCDIERVLVNKFFILFLIFTRDVIWTVGLGTVTFVSYWTGNQPFHLFWKILVQMEFVKNNCFYQTLKIFALKKYTFKKAPTLFLFKSKQNEINFWSNTLIWRAKTKLISL